MIFENEELSFRILDVLKINQENVNLFNSGRNFDALSFRLSADTYLKTKTDSYYMGDSSVCFVPARLDYSRVSKKDELIVIHMDTVNYFANGIEYFVPENPERLGQLFSDIFDIWSKKELGYKHRCSAVLYEIFAECYKENYKEKTGKDKICASVEYIMKNYCDPDISIKAAAERSYMSEVYFRRIFRERFGTSPQKYIIKLRIQNAVGLILSGYYSLKEIAFMSGYTDYKYFSTEFKRITGVSPSEYSYDFMI